MDYFNRLYLCREPFANSPDPDFFFRSPQHVVCLQKLALSIRLRRGLNVVTGDAGTGKTTLCRRLICDLAEDPQVDIFLLLDPLVKNSQEALKTLGGLFGLDEKSGNERQLRESIRCYLFRRGVEEGKTTVLLVDEGQKLPDFFVELLREFLNYETNTYKLLQVVIFAQPEFEQILKNTSAFTDRINVRYHLHPMTFRETQEMIRFRLAHSADSAASRTGLPHFTGAAVREIHRHTGGYPRKIIHLCHQCLLMMIVRNRHQADRSLVRACIREQGQSPGIFHPGAAGLLVILLILLIIRMYPEIAGLFRDRPDTVAVISSPSGSAEKTPVIKSPSLEDRPELPVSPGPAYPEILGELSIEPGETLGELVKAVYGTLTPGMLQQVISRNPDITDPRRITAGQKIVFPAIPVERNGLPDTGYWLRTAETRRLETAFDLLRLCREAQVPIRLIPWQPQGSSLEFALILDDYFATGEAAQERIASLKKNPGLEWKIIKISAKEAVFFSEPFLTDK